MEWLAKRVQQNLRGKVEKVVMNSQGEVKMSNVLENFVSPYLETARNHNDRLTLLSIAVFAWNVALLPEDQQQHEIEKIVSRLVSDKSFR